MTEETAETIRNATPATGLAPLPYMTQVYLKGMATMVDMAIRQQQAWLEANPFLKPFLR